MIDILRWLIQISLTFLSMVTIYWLLSKTKPSETGGSDGVIKPNKSIIFILFALGVGGLWLSFFFTEKNDGMNIVNVFVLAVSFLLMTSLLSLHKNFYVRWNEIGVTGPSYKALKPLTWFNTTYMRWDEVVLVNEDGLQNTYLEAADGKRLYWSYTYSGYPAFEKAVSRHLNIGV